MKTKSSGRVFQCQLHTKRKKRQKKKSWEKEVLDLTRQFGLSRETMKTHPMSAHLSRVSSPFLFFFVFFLSYVCRHEGIEGGVEEKGEDGGGNDEEKMVQSIKVRVVCRGVSSAAEVDDGAREKKRESLDCLVEPIATPIIGQIPGAQKRRNRQRRRERDRQIQKEREESKARETTGGGFSDQRTCGVSP